MADSSAASHNNGINTDNRATNLRWDTRAANVRDRVAHGRQVGAGNPFSKLSEEQVLAILASTRSASATAKEHGVSRATVKDIRAGRSWRRLPRKATP